MIENGNPDTLGAVPDKDGVNFAIYSSSAASIELCLFDDAGRQTMSYRLPGVDKHVHHGYLPGIGAGQLYGYRAHGEWAPELGIRHNPAKLLIDPYARELRGEFRWNYAVFDYSSDETPGEVNTADSADFMPKCVVCDDFDALGRGPQVPWSETIFYETNVRGYTMMHPALDEASRGTFRGMTQAAVLEHLKALGVTSVELMPIQYYIDEHHLDRIGLRNYWGYNSIAFMAPMSRFASGDPNAEFRDMVNAIHDAGLEVILDVVFNHTAEGDSRGPTLSFRALDNLAYYRTIPGTPQYYVNDSGTGNTINADSPIVQRLIMDSLDHWTNTMGVDGFRFDLATILGRRADGFDSKHPLLEAIVTTPELMHAKMIAEPWDPGPGGYQLGEFPGAWAEWNDRYRDGARRFWRGDAGQAGEFARRLHGSADIFEGSGRPPSASVNFVAAHDGFTLSDSVSYIERHNEANGENNRDGHAHNCSLNYGVEGKTDDPVILAKRRQHRLNLMASLLLSQGTPMLLAGDEFGNGQSGNNNAYAQDNEIGWVDWQGLEDDPEFTDQVKTLIALRKELLLLRLDHYVHEDPASSPDSVRIDWLSPDGETLKDHEWIEGRSKLVLLERNGEAAEGLLIAVNGSAEDQQFRMPKAAGNDWLLRFSSSANSRGDGAPNETLVDADRLSVGANSIALLVSAPG